MKPRCNGLRSSFIEEENYTGNRSIMIKHDPITCYLASLIVLFACGLTAAKISQEKIANQAKIEPGKPALVVKTRHGTANLSQLSR